MFPSKCELKSRLHLNRYEISVFPREPFWQVPEGVLWLNQEHLLLWLFIQHHNRQQKWQQKRNLGKKKTWPLSLTTKAKVGRLIILIDYCGCVIFYLLLSYKTFMKFLILPDVYILNTSMNMFELYRTVISMSLLSMSF